MTNVVANVGTIYGTLKPIKALKNDEPKFVPCLECASIVCVMDANFRYYKSLLIHLTVLDFLPDFLYVLLIIW